MNGWRKRDDGKGPPFYVVETPGLRPRPMYSRAEVEAFSLRPRRPGRPTVRDLLIERVEALELAVAALGAKP
jgi:hypothetical protein